MSGGRWWLRRAWWAATTLLAVTLLTFVALDAAGLDRAALEAAQRAEQRDTGSLGDREVELARLRIRYGLVDPQTLEPRPVLLRYGSWLQSALCLRLHGPGEDPVEFRRRIARALPSTLLLGGAALLLAATVGLALGSRLGMDPGSRRDRAASAAMLWLSGLPEALLATLLVLLFCGPVFDLLPFQGLSGDLPADASLWRRAGDLLGHLLLPALAMALGPTLLITRFLRESVARAKDAPFAQNLVAWGIEPQEVRRRVLRAALAPAATLAGSLLPMLVSGSIVVETVFAIDGLGRLLWSSVRGQDHAMVMALTLLMSAFVLLALSLSDWLHRVVDPRVRLQP